MILTERGLSLSDHGKLLREMNDALLVSAARQHELTEEAQQAERFLHLQKDALEVVVRGAPLAESIDALARAFERQSSEKLFVAIHLLDETGTCFGECSAPSLPKSYGRAIAGVEVRSKMGSCGMAVLTGATFSIPDITADPQWSAFARLALPLGIRASWSTPIFSSAERIIGTFAICSTIPGTPDANDVRVVEVLVRTATLAIERKQAEEALQAHKDGLEHTIAERTVEITHSHRQLATAERMAAVGTLAAGLAHDMSNELLPLGIRLDMLLTHLSVDGATHDHLVAVQGLLNHLREMARNLTLFARDPDHEGSVGHTDLSDWSSRAWRFIEVALRVSEGGRNQVRLECDIPDDLPPVPIAPHRLTQVVLNLMHNSRTAILSRKADGDQRVETAAAEPGLISLKAWVDDDGAGVGAGVGAGDGVGDGVVRGARTVSIMVRDNGCRMDVDTMRRSIEPFFTTHDRPRHDSPSIAGGSGMGLSLTHSIVERVGGRLHLESQPGRGTAVTMTFPIAAAVPVVQLGTPTGS